MKKIILLLNNAPQVRQKIVERHTKLTSEGFIPVIVAESSFLGSQTLGEIEVDYCLEKFIEENNVGIEKIELNNVRNQDINIWESYYSDYERDVHFKNRFKRSIIQTNLILAYNFFDEIFRSEEPVAIIYENVSNSFAYAAYNLSKKYGIRYIGITTARIPNRVFIHNSVFDDSSQYLAFFRNALDNNYALENHERKYLEEHILNLNSYTPDYMKVNNLGVDVSLLRFLSASKLGYVFSAIKYDISRLGKSKNLQSNSYFKTSLINFLKNFTRKIKLKVLEYIHYEHSDLTDKYYLYPLHFHPESSTSVIARPFANELEIIQNISFSLPLGTTLYVKDHPSAAGFMSLSFYKFIARLPNVKFISHKEGTKELIKNSLAVITLTSTVGFEALLMNKKVFLFGSLFYDKHPNCVKITNLSNLFEHFVNLETSFYEPFDTLYAYYKQTYPIDLPLKTLIQ